MVKSRNSLKEEYSKTIYPLISTVVFNCTPAVILPLLSERAYNSAISGDPYQFEKKSSGSIPDYNFTSDQNINHYISMEATFNFPLTATFISRKLNAFRLSYFWLLMFICLGFSLHAQDNQAAGSNIRFSKTMAIVMEKTLPFGSKLGMDSISPAATWEIADASGTIASGSGNSMNEYVFAIPGDYEISIHENITFEPGSCQHNTCPDMIQLKVTNTRMTFHHDEISFSEPIRVAVETQGTVMNVPVTIERYNAFLPLDYTYTEVKSAGIETDISAELMPGTVLTEGKQALVYQLNGKAHKPAYLMFDFIDINGMVQLYAMQQPVLQ